MAQRRSEPAQRASTQSAGGRMVALSLAESASARIVELLHSGAYQPGQRLPSERTLATELGVSRSVLREALRTLEAAGLVEARGGSGRYVTGYGSSDALASPPLTNWMKLHPTGDIVAVRRILEPEAIMAIPAARLTDMAAMAREAFEEMKRAVRRGSLETAAELHTRFHLVLVQYAPTRLMRQILASMIEAVSVAQLEVFRTPQAGKHSLQRHEAIVEALEAGDVHLAAERVAEHLEPAFTYPLDRGR